MGYFYIILGFFNHLKLIFLRRHFFLVLMEREKPLFYRLFICYVGGNPLELREIRK